MSGRKPIYQPENLEIGGKMQLLGKALKFKDQYLYQFNKRNKGKFQLVREGKKIFVERLA
jgi:hypothetical protein